MNRVEIDRRGRVAVNSVRIEKILSIKTESRPNTFTGIMLEFDADDVEFVEEIREEKPQKYDTVEIFNYAIEGIENEISRSKIWIEENFDKISHLINLKKALKTELEELSGYGKA